MSALEFDRFGAALFYKPQRISHRVVRAGVKRTVGHVGHQQRTLDGAAHGLQVDQNFFERHRHRIAITEHDIPKAVADENDVYAGFIHDSSGWVIVGRQTDQPLASLFADLQRRRIYFFGTLRLEIRHISTRWPRTGGPI